jgi:hypothetical protein
VIQNNDLYPIQHPGWQLLAEFSVSAKAGYKRPEAERAIETMQDLGLQSAQTERIRGAITEALEKATQLGDQGQRHVTALVRIWIPDARIGGHSRSNTDGASHTRRERRGWGFFLVEKDTDNLQASGVEALHTVEVFLYQEGPRAKG